MDCPELYAKYNDMQQRDASTIISTFIKKMTWKRNEIILDIGCGPGNVTSKILYQLLKDKIKRIVGVDKSAEMVEYAMKNYKCASMDFKVLDIENVDDCTSHSQNFDKIFSFFCFHWVQNKVDALFNMHSMLKHGGEVLIYFLLINPLVELYKHMDDEWQIYIKDISLMSHNVYTYDEIKSTFTKVGFRIVHVESNLKKYTFKDFSSLLNATKAVDLMYNVLPPHLHDKYYEHAKEKICERNMIHICPDTGKTTTAYLPITIHAIKD